MKSRTLQPFLVLLLADLGAFAAPAVAQAVIVVPTDQPTIQAAVDAAADGDVILVEPGIYHERVDVSGRTLVLRSRRGAQATVIDGDQGGTVIAALSGPSDLVIEGFTIRGGSSLEGGGVHTQGSVVRLSRCVVRDNVAQSLGGGVSFATGDAVVEDCVFTNNTVVQGRGGGLFAGWNSDVEIRGSTFFRNHGLELFSGSPGLWLNGDGSITDSIHRENDVLGILYPPSVSTADVALSHCNFEYSAVWPPAGHIDADPLFVGADAGDLHLLATSPCIAAGGGAGGGGLDLEGDPRGLGPSADVGADEHHPHLYHRARPGEVDLVSIGRPPGSPFVAWISAQALRAPLASPYGDLWLSGSPKTILAGVAGADGLLIATYPTPPLAGPVALFAQGVDVLTLEATNLDTVLLF